MDEVGRGPLAGPVVAAAVIIDRHIAPPEILSQIRDSKTLSEQKIEYLFNKIHEFSQVSVSQCSVEEIDDINILQASLRAMQKAVDTLKLTPAHALIDGNKAPKLSCTVQTVIKGDSKSLSIAAASIVAKYTRDRMMTEFAQQYPHYGWETNAGYGTAAHLKAIQTHGVTPLHRKSFAPIRNYLLTQASRG